MRITKVFKIILILLLIVWLSILTLIWKDLTNLLLDIVVLLSLLLTIYILIVSSSAEGKRTKTIFGLEVQMIGDEFCTIGKSIIGTFLILLPFLNNLIIQICSYEYGYVEGYEMFILFTSLVEVTGCIIILTRRSKSIVLITLGLLYSVFILDSLLGVFNSEIIAVCMLGYYFSCLLFCNRIMREANLPRFLTRDIFVRGEKNIDD